MGSGSSTAAAAAKASEKIGTVHSLFPGGAGTLLFTAFRNPRTEGARISFAVPDAVGIPRRKVRRREMHAAQRALIPSSSPHRATRALPGAARAKPLGTNPEQWRPPFPRV